MARIIQGTEDFGAGPYSIPTGVDNGNQASKITNEFMVRMATHTHDNVSSKAAGLPPNDEQKFTGIAFVGPVNGKYTASLILDSITTNFKNVTMYYKLTTDPDQLDSWIEFHPNYSFGLSGNVINIETNRNDIDIRVVA